MSSLFLQRAVPLGWQSSKTTFFQIPFYIRISSFAISDYWQNLAHLYCYYSVFSQLLCSVLSSLFNLQIRVMSSTWQNMNINSLAEILSIVLSPRVTFCLFHPGKQSAPAVMLRGANTWRVWITAGSLFTRGGTEEKFQFGLCWEQGFSYNWVLIHNSRAV